VEKSALFLWHAVWEPEFPVNLQHRVTESTVDELRQLVAQGPPFSPTLLKCLRQDTRAGVQALYELCMRARKQERAEVRRLDEMMAYEREVMANGFTRIAGVDEAGRGPLAGPLVAAAVILTGPAPAGVNDSKQLTAEQRELLYEIIMNGGHCVGVGIIDHETIDRYGLQSANYGAMAQAAANLNPPADFLLVDGFEIRGCSIPQKHIIKGDCLSASIAAASIIAKVTRDRIMCEMDVTYPGYGFAQNKGYRTREHFKALAALGPCPIHRRSFAPVGQPESEEYLFEL
jgi:ribonuclease HII